MKDKEGTDLGRRDFLRRLGVGAGSAMAMMALEPLSVFAQEKDKTSVNNRMTFRIQHGTNEQISLLGFGMMRLPDDQTTWAHSCQDCEVCLSKCPQQIRIPNQMARIIETMRK